MGDDKRGYLPDVYREFRASFPEVSSAHDRLAGFPSTAAAFQWANEVLEHGGHEGDDD